MSKVYTITATTPNEEALRRMLSMDDNVLYVQPCLPVYNYKGDKVTKKSRLAFGLSSSRESDAIVVGGLSLPHASEIIDAQFVVGGSFPRFTTAGMSL